SAWRTPLGTVLPTEVGHALSQSSGPRPRSKRPVRRRDELVEEADSFPYRKASNLGYRPRPPPWPIEPMPRDPVMWPIERMPCDPLMCPVERMPCERLEPDER